MNPNQIDIALGKTLGTDYRKFTFLLAVSGGRDSMTLLYLFKLLKLNIVVAHVNYQLRGEDSNLDEELVTTYCKTNLITVEVLKSDTKSYCEKHKLGTQEAARNIRYDWFGTLKEKYRAKYIVTAHHQNDVIETFFINLSRGSGVKGLKSISYLHEDKLRPFIGCSREEITNYAKNNKITFRDDQSNKSNNYLRNQLRNQILPFINSEIEGFEKGVTKSIDFLKMDAEYLYKQLEKETEKVLIIKNEVTHISEYSKLSKRLLFHILQKFGFNYSQFNNILENGKSGNTFSTENYKLTLNRGVININTNTINPRYINFRIDSFGVFNTGNFTIEITTTSRPKNLLTEPHTAYFSTNKLKFPLTVRTWKEGDFFQPFGMKGRKKISDFFIDQKIGISEKSKINILESNGEIVWIIGFRTSENFKVDSDCQEVIKIVTK